MKWLKFFRLSGPDKILFLKIAGLLSTARFCLLLLEYKTVLNLFDWLADPPSPRSLSDDASYLERVVTLTRTAGRRFLGSKPCLPQSLVVECLLKRQGISASMKIGVTKGEEDQLLAHAWVESSGEIVIGGRLSPSRYARLQPLKTSQQ